MSLSPVLIWFLLGLILILLEFAIPGVILVFFGLGAWITCITSWLHLTDGWTSQLLTFGISSVVLLLLLRRWLGARLRGYVGDAHDPSDNIDEFKGARVVVTVEITPGKTGGKVEYKGAAWSAVSETALAAGDEAVVEKADGITLVVRPR
jgi:membrane protein implicated in regulation of membrane protease activity